MLTLHVCKPVFDHVRPPSDLLGHSQVDILTRLCDEDVAVYIQAILVIDVCVVQNAQVFTLCIAVQGAWCYIRSGLTTGQLPWRSHDGSTGCVLCVSTTGELM